DRRLQGRPPVVIHVDRLAARPRRTTGAALAAAPGFERTRRLMTSRAVIGTDRATELGRVAWEVGMTEEQLIAVLGVLGRPAGTPVAELALKVFRYQTRERLEQ